MPRALVLLLALLAASPAPAAGPVKVVTTLPDLADWVREIGGARVEVKSLLQGFENPHTYEPKVSDVKAVAGARLLVRVGLGLEEWLDGLVENARNTALTVVDASRGVSVLEDGRATGGGAHGDHEHARGNPHVWLDPANAEIMCRNIAAALEAADPQAGEAYQEGLASYLERLGETTRRLRQIVQTLPDRRFLSYHAAWPYFARGMGFQVVGVVTEMPGQEPSAKALAGLLERIRTEQIRVLATEPQLSSKIPDLLAQESGIRTVTLSPLLGAGPAKTYLELLEADTRALAQALGGPRP